MSTNNSNYPQYYSYSNPKNDYKSVPQDYDIESSPQVNYKADYDLQIRLGFIRKVYGILSVQLLLTSLLCGIATVSENYKHFVVTNPALMYFSIFVSLATIIALMCFKSVASKVPVNYILLTLFTLAEAYMVSVICCMSNPKIVLMAASLTCCMTIALTLYAFTTKKDFTVYGSLLFVGSCIMVFFSIFFIFVHSNILHLIICCFGVFLYSIYLIYDTQLIVGNKQNYLETDDYIVAALMLYVDIINLFIYLLQIMNELSGKN